MLKSDVKNRTIQDDLLKESKKVMAVYKKIDLLHKKMQKMKEPSKKKKGKNDPFFDGKQNCYSSAQLRHVEKIVEKAYQLQGLLKVDLFDIHGVD